jgi:PKD repeat protein
MKKALLLFICSILLSWSLFATQINILSEIFSSTGCPYCPSAQLGLEQLYDGHPNVIPISWYTSLLGSTVISPNANTRLSFYGGGGIPHTRFAGNVSVVGGGGTTMYSTFLQRYNQIINRVSPLEITPSLELSGDNQLVISADVNVTEAFTETTNKICFVITQHPDTPPYRFLALGYAEQPFNLTSVGQTQLYTASIPYNENWDIAKLRAVVFVQTWAGDKKVLQSAQTGFSGMMTMFTADVTTGPKDLTVNFQDKSLPSGGIVEWKWDFDNDGTYDSYEQNPTHTFTQEGSYSVKLTVSDGTEELTMLKENFITVTGINNISGNVQGVWKPEYGTYTISGDLTIPENSSLTILPGTNLQFAENTGMNIYGKFTVGGESAPVVFTTTGNFWKGIVVNATADTAFFNNCRFDKAMTTAIKTITADIIVKSCRFTNNISTALPSAIDIAGSDNSEITGSYFANNCSTNNCSGVNISTSTVNIKNNVFVNNTGRNAGALMIRNNSTVNLINNTIVNNKFSVSPGAQILVNNAVLESQNNIIRGTSTLTNINGTVNMQYTNISGGAEGTGNIDSDPLFSNPTTEEGYQFPASIAGWYLTNGSPCIDAGNPAESYNDPAAPGQTNTALAPAMGTLRNDMGAFGGNGIGNWLPESDIVIEKPVNLSLLAYPNPFNPNINIQFTRNSMQNENVNVNIYNAKGQKVRNLFNGSCNSKTIQLNWNGTNADNKTLPSGIYFIKAVSGNETISKKVILLK